MSNSLIWPIDRTLSGAITLGQSGPESDGNEGALRVPQALKAHCLVSYPGLSLGESYPSSEMQSVYSTAPSFTLCGVLSNLVIYSLRVRTGRCGSNQKHLLYESWKRSSSQYNNQMVEEISLWVARSSTIRHGNVGLSLWIQRKIW